jgi:hypothetical protein
LFILESGELPPYFKGGGEVPPHQIGRGGELPPCQNLVGGYLPPIKSVGAENCPPVSTSISIKRISITDGDYVDILVISYVVKTILTGNFTLSPTTFYPVTI